MVASDQASKLKIGGPFVLARDIMTRTVVSTSPDAEIADLAKLMLKRHISGLPVVDQDGRLIGMVTEDDPAPPLSS